MLFPNEDKERLNRVRRVATHTIDRRFYLNPLNIKRHPIAHAKRMRLHHFVFEYRHLWRIIALIKQPITPY